jgi:hypothetical protein
MVQSSRVKSGGIRGIKEFAGARNVLELLGPTNLDRVDQRRIAVINEVGEGCSLSILLTHKEHGDVRTQYDEGRDESILLGRDRGDQAIAEGPVTDLVVVLGEDDESLRRQMARGRAVTAAAKR